MKFLKRTRTFALFVLAVGCWTGQAQDQNNRACDTSPAIKVADFEGPALESDWTKLQQIIPVMESHPHSHGFIVMYAGRSSTLAEAQRRADQAKRKVLDNREWINQSDVLNSRLNTLVCGFRETAAMELWVTPVGAAPPVCGPTVAKPETPAKRPPPRRR